ncbi:MAG: nuclear transport factor 2 family protein [Usitatibacteraceae bacterium]
MKVSLRSPVVTIAALMLCAGCGSLPPADSSSAEIEKAHAKLAKAFSTCDEAAFTDAYAEDFSFFTSNTRNAIKTKDGLRAYLAASCRLTPNPTASITTQLIRFLGADAVVTGQYLFRVPNGANIADVPQNFTALFARHAGGWKVAAHHVSLAPCIAGSKAR